MKTIIGKVIRSYSSSILLTQPFFKIGDLDLARPEFELSSLLKDYDSSRVTLKYAVCNSIDNAEDIIKKNKFKEIEGTLRADSSTVYVGDGLDEYFSNKVALIFDDYSDFDFGEFLSNKTGKVIIIQIKKQG